MIISPEIGTLTRPYSIGIVQRSRVYVHPRKLASLDGSSPKPVWIVSLGNYSRPCHCRC